MKKQYASIFFLLITSCTLVHSTRQAAYAACLSFPDLIHNGSYGVAGLAGRFISSCNVDTPFIPASIAKIQTALAAFNILGKDFRFKTAFYVDRENNLYIKGYGDPLLTSEEVDLVLHRLQEKGVNTIHGIFIDNSSFALSKQVPGRGTSDNPYDTPVGAIGVNFNTVNIRVDRQGKAVSAEPQTPTLPLMDDLAKGRKAGTYRINICQDDCRPEDQAARYTAELFRGLQHRLHIGGDGPVAVMEVPGHAELIYMHENSRNLEEVIYSFMQYSNNYLANQVFLLCGTEKYGYPATWDKARRSVHEALEKILGNDTADDIFLEEGSGLSRNNRVTTRAMLETLHAFAPYKHLIQEKKGVLVKSGTLDGVYNYAGYFADERSFVILLNQKQNSRDPLRGRLESLFTADDR